MKRQLLCTFSTSEEYKSLLATLRNFYSVSGNKFFLFQNTKSPNFIFITYNVEVSDGSGFPKFPNTIGLHRKKQTNTLYTLNAMNRLIAEENGGVFDNKFQLNWELYSNSLILTGEVSVRIIPIKLCDIIS
jgi:hypothetical protein